MAQEVETPAPPRQQRSPAAPPSEITSPEPGNETPRKPGLSPRVRIIAIVVAVIALLGGFLPGAGHLGKCHRAAADRPGCSLPGAGRGGNRASQSERSAGEGPAGRGSLPPGRGRPAALREPPRQAGGLALGIWGARGRRA